MNVHLVWQPWNSYRLANKNSVKFFWEDVNLCTAFYCLCNGVLSLEIQSWNGEACDLIKRLNPVTVFSLFQAKTWYSNVISSDLFLCSIGWGERWLFVLVIAGLPTNNRKSMMLGLCTCTQHKLYIISIAEGET